MDSIEPKELLARADREFVRALPNYSFGLGYFGASLWGWHGKFSGMGIWDDNHVLAWKFT